MWSEQSKSKSNRSKRFDRSQEEKETLTNIPTEGGGTRRGRVKDGHEHIGRDTNVEYGRIGERERERGESNYLGGYALRKDT